jgi:hypothetical protein
MTLVEALKKGDLVRRTTWPWWKCYNNIKHDPTQIWQILERPAQNRWATSILYEDAIAEDWETIKEIP